LPQMIQLGLCCLRIGLQKVTIPTKKSQLRTTHINIQIGFSAVQLFCMFCMRLKSKASPRFFKSLYVAIVQKRQLNGFLLSGLNPGKPLSRNLQLIEKQEWKSSSSTSNSMGTML